MNVVGDTALVQELVELLGIDAMRPLDLAVQMRRCRPDVDMANIQALDVPMKLRLKLGAVVGLQDVDAKR